MKGDVSVLSDVGRLRHRRGYGRGREGERRSIAKGKVARGNTGEDALRPQREGRKGSEGESDEPIHRSYLTYRSNS